ncbi:MAG: phenylalanine--tRNA ligase subunit beta [Lewinellaceae bacterium]|nr:phenylalanine--tRNA ligase subunit beta [Lewinellaceae bacterium]
MKLSFNWLKKYLHIPYTPEKIAEMLTLIGLEAEGIECVESIKGSLEGIVVGQVLTCQQHPNADKLSLTTVDIGGDEPLNIVCGAPNVAAGQKVMVATIGTKLYPKEGDPWVIKKGNIRGEASMGMICAEDELGLGDDHSGIIVLPEDTPIGMLASEYYKIEQDYVFDIGLTPNRSDATSQLGVARDLLAYLRVNEKYEEELIDPDISGFITQKVALNIDVEVLDKQACPRYSGITINNVTVGESPQWLKNLLKAIGVRPINNIVDITNFVLNELGQPLHAFDAMKISGKKIVVSKLQDKTPFVSLDHETRSLSSDDLMICDGDLTGLCMAGVFGGESSGVTTETQHIFLESACFDANTIRRTSMKHNLRTDAAKIFEKGADPNITIYALKRAASLIREIAGGEISNTIVDVYPHEIKPVEIRLHYAKVHQLIGMHIPIEDIHSILSAMDMEITPLDDESILVKVPTNKVDVLRDVDLIEEIVRIYGLNKVPISDQIRSTISYSTQPNKYKVKEMVADFLSSRGLNEIMGLSLMESKFFKDKSDLIIINNTSNISLDVMRPSMLLSGLQTISYNLNRQQSNIAMYEFGKAYSKNDASFSESEQLSIFISGKQNEESWLANGKKDVDYFDIKYVINSLLERLNLGNLSQEIFQNSQHLKYGTFLKRGSSTIGYFGEVDQEVLSTFGIKTKVFYGNLLMDEVMTLLKGHKIKVSEISKYPTVRRDLALILDKKITFEEVIKVAKKVDNQILKHIGLFDVYVNEQQVGKDKKSYAVSFLFENLTRTLKDEEVDGIMKKISTNLAETLGANIRT